jgi:uncharacterized protein (TIGR02145 family)
MKKKRVITIRCLSLLISCLLLMMTSNCKKDEDNNHPEVSYPIIFNPALSYDTVRDIDGNVYKTIAIGDQIWLAENLKTTKYNDGKAIPFVQKGFTAMGSPAYCWVYNDVNLKNTYGAIYNWYTVNTGKLAPKGWHIPNGHDWFVLTTFLGGDSIAGGKMKETGLSHWLSPNSGATNSSGFTALPAGTRINEDESDVGVIGQWWTVDEAGTYCA